MRQSAQMRILVGRWNKGLNRNRYGWMDWLDRCKCGITMNDWIDGLMDEDSCQIALQVDGFPNGLVDILIAQCWKSVWMDGQIRWIEERVNG